MQTIYVVDSPGTHIIGIVAIYQNGQSEMGSITINVATDLSPITLSPIPSTAIYDLQGRKVRFSSSLPHGVYIKKDGVPPTLPTATTSKTASWG